MTSHTTWCADKRHGPYTPCRDPKGHNGPVWSAERILAAEDSRRRCVQCGAEVHPTDGPHLCKTYAKRLKRQTDAIDAVYAILAYGQHTTVLAQAEDILAYFAGRDLGL